MAWKAGWLYRKSHVINAASGAGTNYQVKVIVHYGAGTDSGADVYLNSHSRTDFQDVRFTDDDGTTLLDYWMESKVDGDNAVFWVEVADDLSSQNQTIYIYYGKSDATTTSNFANTFIDHDDFEDGTDGQPPAGWTTSTGITLTVSTTSTYVNKGTKGLRCLSNGGGTDEPAYRSLTTISGDKNRAIEFWIKVVTEQQGYYQYVILGDGATIKFYFAMCYPEGGSRYISYHNGSAWVSVMPYVVGTWYRIKIYNIDFTNRKFDMDVDGVNKVAGGTFYAAATQFNRFMKAAGGGTTWDEALDTIFVRKCVSPEPSHGSWGSEEVTPAIRSQQISVLSSPLKQASKPLSQSVSVAVSHLRVSQYRRELLQQATASTLPTKASSKAMSQLMSVYTAYTIIIPALAKFLTQTISVTSLHLKDVTSLKTQPISILPSSFKHPSRLLLQPVSVTSLAFKDSKSVVVQSISVSEIPATLTQYRRIYSQAASISTLLFKTPQVPKTQMITILPTIFKDSLKLVSQPVTVLQILQRIATFQRVQTQPVSTLALLEKQPYKSLMQIITQATYVSKASEIPRIQMIEVPTSLVKTSQKPLSQVVSVASTPAWLLQLIRLLTQPVTVDVSTVKQVAKVKPEVVSVLTTPTTIAQFLRTLTQPATILPVAVKAPTKVKTETISVATVETFVSQYRRVLSQPIIVLTAPTTILQLIRVLTQPVTVVTTPSWYRELLKVLAQSVSVDTVLAKAIQKYATEIVKPCVIEMVYVPELGRFIIIIDNELGILS